MKIEKGEVVFQYTIREAISDGYLCPVRGYRVKTEIDLSGPVCIPPVGISAKTKRMKIEKGEGG